VGSPANVPQELWYMEGAGHNLYMRLDGRNHYFVKAKQFLWLMVCISDRAKSLFQVSVGFSDPISRNTLISQDFTEVTQPHCFMLFSVNTRYYRF